MELVRSLLIRQLMLSFGNPVEQRLFVIGQNSGLTDFVKWFKFLIVTTSGLLTICFSSSHAMPESASDQTSPIPVVVQFDWIFNAQFAGFYQGIEQGFFLDQGLRLELRGGVTTANTVSATVEVPGLSVGSTESNVLIAEVAEGADVVALGTMFQDSPMGWMYIKGGNISKFSDLADRRIGIHSDGARVIELLLREAGADTSELDTFKASHDPQPLLDGKLDALQCYYIDEFVKLQQEVGNRAGIFLARDHGYKAYSQVMFTDRNTALAKSSNLRGFLKAAKLGWAYAFANPEETIDLILEKYNPSLDRDYQLRSLAKIRELMEPEPGSLFRPMHPDVLENGQSRLLEYGLISDSISIKDLLSQQFLPHD